MSTMTPSEQPPVEESLVTQLRNPPGWIRSAALRRIVIAPPVENQVAILEELFYLCGRIGRESWQELQAALHAILNRQPVVFRELLQSWLDGLVAWRAQRALQVLQMLEGSQPAEFWEGLSGHLQLMLQDGSAETQRLVEQALTSVGSRVGTPVVAGWIERQFRQAVGPGRRRELLHQAGRIGPNAVCPAVVAALAEMLAGQTQETVTEALTLLPQFGVRVGQRPVLEPLFRLYEQIPRWGPVHREILTVIRLIAPVVEADARPEGAEGPPPETWLARLLQVLYRDWLLSPDVTQVAFAVQELHEIGPLAAVPPIVLGLVEHLATRPTLHQEIVEIFRRLGPGAAHEAALDRLGYLLREGSREVQQCVRGILDALGPAAARALQQPIPGGGALV
jgi:hypothetical protein